MPSPRQNFSLKGFLDGTTHIETGAEARARKLEAEREKLRLQMEVEQQRRIIAAQNLQLQQYQQQQRETFEKQKQAGAGAAGASAPAGAAGTKNNNEPADEVDLVGAASAADASTGSIYEEYRNQEIPHPDPVVETASLSQVSKPLNDVEHHLQDVVKQGKISSLQLESVLCAFQRFTVTDSKKGGFLLADGTGVGKGRQVAAMALEFWRRGGKRILWVSVSSDLAVDAVRDLNDLAVETFPFINANKLPPDTPVKDQDGMVFCTYHLLTNAKRNPHVVAWLLDEPMIIFDEAHKAKNLESSKTAKAVSLLQETLPKASVVYCSATGTTEPSKITYMDRLGRWGFDTMKDFTGSIEKLGLGGMEIAAMGLKATGCMLSRTLSYAGAEFGLIDVELEEDFRKQYKDATKIWSVMLEAFKELHEGGGIEDPQSFWRQFWAAHQRFFKQMLLASKVPSITREARRAVDEGMCVVIGLQSTGEAASDNDLADFVSPAKHVVRQFVAAQFPEQAVVSDKFAMNFCGNLADAISNYKKDEDFKADFSKTTNHTAEQIVKFINVFLRNEDTKTRNLRQLNIDRCTELRNSLVRKQTTAPIAKRAKNEVNLETEFRGMASAKLMLLKAIEWLDLPPNPLDHIIDALGGPEAVAEMTGRKGQVVRQGDDFVHRPRSSKNVNIVERETFQQGKKLIAVISEACSVGVSLHADKRVKNQRRRMHITMELPWSAEKAMQQFGRSHRANQSSTPVFQIMISPVGGEYRFASSAAKRLAQLGACIQADRRAMGAGVNLKNFDVNNNIGHQALLAMCKTVAPGDPYWNLHSSPCVVDGLPKAEHFKDLLADMGLYTDRLWTTRGNIFTVPKFLNRLLGLDIDDQNKLFDHFNRCFEAVTTHWKITGKHIESVVSLNHDNISVEDAYPKLLNTHEASGAKTWLWKLIVDQGCSWESMRTKVADSHFQFWTENKIFRRAVCLPGETAPARRVCVTQDIERSDMIKRIQPQRLNCNVVHKEDFEATHTPVEDVEEAEKLWKFWYDFYAEAAEEHGVSKRKTPLYVVSGAVLPILKDLTRVLEDNTKVVRVVVTDRDNPAPIVGISLTEDQAKKIPV